MKSHLHAVLTTALLLASAPTWAVYKCESGGKVTYSDQPCAGGKALDIESTPPADAKRTEKQSADEKKLLKQLEDDKRKRAASEEKQRQRAQKAQASHDKQCASLARRQQWANEDAASATGKSVEKARRKARRATEHYEQECGTNGRRTDLAS